MAILVKSENLGWLAALDRNETGKIVSTHWSANQKNAKPYRVGDPELVEIHEHLYNNRFEHEMVREYVFWFDRDE